MSVVLYVNIIYDMQSKRKLAQLSRYRAVLREAIDELAELIQVGYERKPMVKGTVYELARKCGKAGCACTRGQERPPNLHCSGKFVTLRCEFHGGTKS